MHNRRLRQIIAKRNALFRLNFYAGTVSGIPLKWTGWTDPAEVC